MRKIRLENRFLDSSQWIRRLILGLFMLLALIGAKNFFPCPEILGIYSLLCIYIVLLFPFPGEVDLQFIHAFSKAIEYKDEYTMGHSYRVARYSRWLAKRLGLSKIKAERIFVAGLLHDIGKIGIPEKILLKSNGLTEEERAEIKSHVQLGVNILREIAGFEDVCLMINEHHERWDGTGYPNGKKGLEISLGGRILAVADAFDAMTSKRVYREELSKNEACEELRRCGGTQFDPRLAEKFAENV